VITVPPQSVSDLQQCNAIGVELDASSSNTVPGTCKNVFVCNRIYAYRCIFIHTHGCTVWWGFVARH